jgi:GTP-binding protein
LIEGASGGAGLGDAFLRHVERTRVLVHVVDVAAPNPERDFAIIREELEARDPALLSKTTLVVANKIDLPEGAANLKAFEKARTNEGLEVVGISARDAKGIDTLLDALARLLPSLEELSAPGEATGVVIHRLESGGSGFAVERDTDGTYRVRGRNVERLVAQTNFDNEESAMRFQRALGRMGIERELERAGVEAGDVVKIGPHELEWGADWA